MPLDIHGETEEPLENWSAKERNAHGIRENGIEQLDKELIDEIYNELKQAKKHFDNYCSLLAFTFYFLVYLAVLYLQAQTLETHKVSQAHLPLLPPDYKMDSAYKFASSDDFYNWLNSSIIQTTWTPLVCGNGICERPHETQAFGPDNSYGCEADCGVFSLTSFIQIETYVNFKTLADQAATSWNLCMEYPLQFCWFKNPQIFSGDLAGYVFTYVNLPDGNWTIRVNAPHGGVLFSVYNSTSSFPNLLEDNQTSNYTLCRQQCRKLFFCANGSRFCPLISNHTYVSAYVVCLFNCQTSYSGFYNNLTSMNCSQLTSELLGVTSCQGDSPSPAAGKITPSVTTYPTGFYTSLIWEKLGASDSTRLYYLASAVQRVLYTFIKDECGIRDPKPPRTPETLTAFLCTFFGGPFNLTGCTYYSRSTPRKILTSDYELLTEMSQLHEKFKIYLDQQTRFTEMISWALQSVTILDESTVTQISLRLRQLDVALQVDSSGLGCVTAVGFYPITVNSSSNTVLTIQAGRAIQFYWADDQEHSVHVTLNGMVYSKGFGAWPLIHSRGTICTSDNLGLGPSAGPPTPCNLVDPKSSPPYTFTHTIMFNEAGDGTYTSVKIGDSDQGNFRVREFNYSTVVCGDSCLLSDIADGKCDSACNIRECLFDGGDCACPLDSNGLRRCTCPPGQIKGTFLGSCIDTLDKEFSLPFQLHNHSQSQDPNVTNAEILPDSSALIRTTANLNRVLIGMLVHQRREKSLFCKADETRFNFIQSKCWSGEAASPFGVQPQTIGTSSLYDQSYKKALDDLYALNKTFSNSSLAFNPEGIAFGFYPTVVKGRNYGFNYLVDVNLNRSAASSLLSYLKEGMFFDNLTAGIQVRLVTYNRQAQMFTLISVETNVEVGGKLAMEADVKSLRLEHYKTHGDWVRLVLEIVFLVCLAIDFLLEVSEFVGRVKKSLPLFAYFQSFWNWFDCASLGIMISGVVIWYNKLLGKEALFEIKPRYDVYELPLTTFNYWKLQGDGSAIVEVIYAFQRLKELSNFRTVYFALQGIKFYSPSHPLGNSILLMSIRMLKLMDFQPRMGAITRTFAEAAPELFHFFIAWLLLFFSFSFLAHIVFGRIIEEYRTIGASMNSCFRVLMGADHPADNLLQLREWELFAGMVFWWSFVIIMFFVVMNLTIGIITDAYSNVKKRSKASNWLPKDVLSALKNTLKRIHPRHHSIAQQVKILKVLAQKNADPGPTSWWPGSAYLRLGGEHKEFFVSEKGVDVDKEWITKLISGANDKTGKVLSEERYDAFVEDILDNLIHLSKEKAYGKEEMRMKDLANVKEELKKDLADVMKEEMKKALARMDEKIEVGMMQLSALIKNLNKD